MANLQVVKTTVSILLLLVLLFNWYGYQFIAQWMETRANLSLDSKIDHSEFKDADLRSVKFPASHVNPYSLQTNFESCDGEVEIGGVLYRFVKRRFVNDSLEFLCIPNTAVNQVRSAKAEFFKLVNDLQAGESNRKANPHSGSSRSPRLSDCEIEHEYIIKDFLHAQPLKNGSYLDQYTSHFTLPAERPPSIG